MSGHDDNAVHDVPDLPKVPSVVVMRSRRTQPKVKLQSQQLYFRVPLLEYHSKGGH